MQSLINITYFTGRLSIGQVSQLEVQEELKEYIAHYEYDFLIKLLGKALYEVFYNEMQGTATTRAKAIAYGSTFLLDTTKVKRTVKVDKLDNAIITPNNFWNNNRQILYAGLLKSPDDDTSTNFISSYSFYSPIAKYIYYHWNKSHNVNIGGVGANVQQTHNGLTVNNSENMVMLWNEMKQEVEDFYYFLDMNIADYPEFNLPLNDRLTPEFLNKYNFL